MASTPTIRCRVDPMKLPRNAIAVLGWGIRFGILLLYAGWVLIGFCMLRHTAVDVSHLQYVAVRELPAGHRLLDQDFHFEPSIPLGERNLLPAGADPAGKYLTKKYEAGKKIAQSEISARSPTHAANNMVEFLFPLEKQPDLVNFLDPDSQVDVCGGVCILQNVRVLSVVCSAAASAECYATLELSADDSKKITGDTKNYRLLPR
jgi:hypothetical protein